MYSFQSPVIGSLIEIVQWLRDAGHEALWAGEQKRFQEPYFAGQRSLHLPSR